MSALIIRLPEEKRTRLKLVAKSRKVSITKLIEEMATILLADFDAETRFELRAARGRGRVAQVRRCSTKQRGNASARSVIEGRRSERGTIARAQYDQDHLRSTTMSQRTPPRNPASTGWQFRLEIRDRSEEI